MCSHMLLLQDPGDSLGLHRVMEAAGPALLRETRYMHGWSQLTKSSHLGMEEFTKFTKFSPVLLRIWSTTWYAQTAQGGLVLPPTTPGPVSVSRRGFQLTRVTWVEVSEKTVVSVSTGLHITEANCKTFQNYKSTFLTLVRIRGRKRTTIHILRGWRRSGWSPWAAWRVWTRWRGQTSGMTPRLGLETGGFDGGVAENIPGFF